MQSPINAPSALFCPRSSCKYYQSLENKISKDGTYTTKSDPEPRQMFRCHGGNHRYSETGYSDLFGKHGSFKEYEQTAKLSSHSLSSDAIADILQKDQRTIEQWQRAIGKKCEQFHLFLCVTIGITILFLQMDELWSFVKNKSRQLWVFIALESQTKFWITFELGSRTIYTASRLVKGLKRLARWGKDCILKVTTDKLAAYKNALEKFMDNIHYVYLQIVKRRIMRRLVTVKKFFVKGTAEDFPDKSQNTSFIERLNLTLRQHICYLQRKTLGYCKSKVNFVNIMWINLFNYNYIQVHKSLRIQINNENKKFIKKYQHNTPAMQMKLTNSPLNWRYLLTFPIPYNY